MSNIFYDEPGPVGQKRARIFNVIGAVFLVTLATAIGVRLYHQGQLELRLWSVLLNQDLVFLLFQGIISTFKAAFAAMVISVLAGIIMAAGLMSHRAWVWMPLRAWIEVFRGLPLLLVFFFVFLGVPALGFHLSSFWSLVIGIALYNSAVFAEIFRAGLMSIPQGQREAGLVIGMTESRTLRIILLPQAITRMLPILVSQGVILLKETSLGFIIGYTELLRQGRTAVEYLGGEYSIPVYTLLAVIYIAINIALSWMAIWLERRQNSKK